MAQASGSAIQTTDFVDVPRAVPARDPVSACARLVLSGGSSIAIGILWDISWHRTIGRDTFWTPAHLAIYIGGLLGGLTCGWLAIRTTFFGSRAEREAAVRLWGFRAPFGAWVTIWGALAMLTSAPFDNWWHNAYGVDVKILSPPHTLLALGMWANVLGALMLLLREQNLADARQAEPNRLAFLYASGLVIVMASVFLIEKSWPNQQRTALFYELSAATLPVYLLGLARASKERWGASSIALIYMAIVAGMAWILPLFPGQPRLGPIRNPVTHFVPLPFPLLLIVPALGIDLARRYIGEASGWLRDWLLVIVCGCLFFALFLLTQWFFSAFLIGPHAQNWFFAADRHWGYREGAGQWHGQFWSRTNPESNPPLTFASACWALALSITASRIGLWLGNWMSRLRR
ncbi:MAG TPA: hypothetical protein VKY92_11870 [Verrucomicrobiae bacterium]|nr:hypothetical protein [Verrucomicrobiae bacterium]